MYVDDVAERKKAALLRGRSASVATRPDLTMARLEAKGSYLLEFGAEEGTPIFKDLSQLKVHAEFEHARAERVQSAIDAGKESFAVRLPPMPPSPRDHHHPEELWSMRFTERAVEFWNANRESIGVIPRRAISYISVIDADFVDDLTTSVKDTVKCGHRVLNCLASCMCLCGRLPCYDPECCLPSTRYKKLRAQIKASEVNVFAGGSEPVKTFYLLDRHLGALQPLLLDPHGDAARRE